MMNMQMCRVSGGSLEECFGKLLELLGKMKGGAR